MKRIRVGGLGLAVAMVVMAATATSAFAVLPEFSGPFAKPFTSTGNASLFETVTGAKLACKAATNVGEITGPQTGTVTITFTGCKLKGIPCNTPGVPPGTIITSLLTITVGYVNKAKKEVGADLSETPGGGFLDYGCGSTTFAKVQGSVIGRITPINKLVIPSKKFVIHFQQMTGKQKVLNLEGGPPDILETSFGGPFEQTGLMWTDQILFGEPVKLVA